LPTGGFNRCWFSPIHFWKLKARSRPVVIAVSVLFCVAA
jgi:hypothetical protein